MAATIASSQIWDQMSFADPRDNRARPAGRLAASARAWASGLCGRSFEQLQMAWDRATAFHACSIPDARIGGLPILTAKKFDLHMVYARKLWKFPFPHR